MIFTRALILYVLGLVFFGVVPCSGALVKVPYHSCYRDDQTTAERGVCSQFGTERIELEVEEGVTDEDISTLCQSDFAAGFYNSMFDTISDWSLEGCVIYLRYFMTAELQAQSYEKKALENKIQFEKLDYQILSELNRIQESHEKMIEGGLWRGGTEDDEPTQKRLAKKRACFRGTLSYNLKEKSHLAEIGFNGGHSSAIMLHMFPTLNITSFDLCAWKYTRPAHAHLVSLYGSRTELICGDSAVTVPAHVPPIDKYDAVFVDAGHVYSQARSDIAFSARLAKSGALVIVDDCDVDMASASDDQLMGIDQVNDAWRHMLAYGIVKPLPVLFDTCQHAGLCIGRFA